MDIEEHAPMMQQYLRIKQDYPQELLFYRLGDFYELFFTDAVRAAELLGITLTNRNQSGQAIPMAGVPFHAADSYIARLLQKGEVVVICEQVGEVQKKGPIMRAVTRIITPGTLIDDTLLNANSDNIIMALEQEGDTFSSAWLELSSGRAGSSTMRGLHNLQGLLARTTPAEILLINVTANIITNARINIIKHVVPGDVNSLRTTFGAAITNLTTQQITALQQLVNYIQYTQKTIPPHLHFIEAQDFLQIDPHSLKNLEITESYVEGAKTLFSAINHTVTAMGARMLKRWLRAPLTSFVAINGRQEASRELQNLSNLSGLLAELRDIGDLERYVGRVSLGKALPHDLVRLRVALQALPKIKAALTTPVLTTLIAQELPDFSALCSLLEQAILDNPARLLRDGEVIRDGFDVQLDEYRALYRDATQLLLTMEEKLRKDTGINSLKVGFNKVHGYYIEMSRMHKQIPSNFIRRQTLKNVERYMTPELQEFEARVLTSRDKAEAQEKYLYEKLLQDLQQEVLALQRAAEALATLDCLQSFVYMAHKFNWAHPAFSAENKLAIVAGRHPVLEALGGQIISNDLQLDDAQKMLIITGPNMGGKSTYMRQVALILILAYAGSFIPAQEATIGKFTQIFTRIGSQDSLTEGRSTFMTEMLEVANLLQNATSYSLVLLDEVGRGTSTYDGLALAWATAVYLARTNCYTLFATHYFELAKLDKFCANVANVHLAVAEYAQKIVFLYKVQEGALEKSFGLHVASLAGMPREVLAIAQNKLQELDKQDNKKEVKPVSNSCPPPSVEPPLWQKFLTELLPDQLTPREALEALYRLKELV